MGKPTSLGAYTCSPLWGVRKAQRRGSTPRALCVLVAGLQVENLRRQLGSYEVLTKQAAGELADIRRLKEAFQVGPASHCGLCSQA